jgi:hypothetical protein
MDRHPCGQPADIVAARAAPTAMERWAEAVDANLAEVDKHQVHGAQVPDLDSALSNAAIAEPAFRLIVKDGALYVDTKHGPVKITVDPDATVETPRVITTCPGYNAVFHIDPDPADLAQRQAERVVEHQRREMQERAIRGAVHAAGARPDGFDQRQVDAARAVLLAPVPRRYPRAR